MDADTERAVEEVRQALLNPGLNPEYHYKVMLAHRRAWPSLWKALDNLMRATAKSGS